jgi:hypothetical protein
MDAVYLKDVVLILGGFMLGVVGTVVWIATHEE